MRPLLGTAELESFRRAHPGWRLEQGELRRTFEFSSFAESMKFVIEVGAVAERENHHPDIDIRYRRVTLALLTYDSDGVTQRDVELAEMMESIWAGFRDGRRAGGT
jgi:4a-hydroxytetrahydrobiopterin dehydratase